MANHPKDDWVKIRSPGQHLTADEIAWLKTQYRAGVSYRDAARALQCSSRIASKYYGFFTAEGVVKNRNKPLPTEPPKSRFYRGSFDL